jgi:rsbT co-antagonist protein RsbR
MRRLWQVYDTAHEELQAGFRERLASHPEFGPLLREIPPDHEQDRQSHMLLGRAMDGGDWESYWRDIRAQATGYANAEISFGSWIELIHLVRDDILDRILALHDGLTEELVADVRALDRWLDDVMAVFGQAFVSANEQVIARQQQAIRQLSTPVLQLRPGLLLLPIVGVLDSERLEGLTGGLLEAIRWRRAGAVVLDVTGVPEIDPEVAHGLTAAIASAHMMGAAVIVSGLSADIAHTLVRAGIGLDRVASAGDLQSGIELAESVLARRR